MSDFDNKDFPMTADADSDTQKTTNDSNDGVNNEEIESAYTDNPVFAADHDENSEQTDATNNAEDDTATDESETVNSEQDAETNESSQESAAQNSTTENYSNYQQHQYTQNAYAYPQDSTVRNPKKKSKGKAVFLAVACILIVFAVGVFAVVFTGGNKTNLGGNGLSDVPYVNAVSAADSEEDGLSAAEVYQKVFKSSVSILAYRQATGELGVLGSGIICQEDTNNKYTYIVTCAHVINDPAYNIKVELWDGTVHTAEVVNFDDTNDIGVVRIRTTGLQIAEFGVSDEIQPGATVYAIGTPYNLKFAGSFTRGMVSAINRLVTTQTGYQLSCIQHDAPINNGNSGGALVNAFGQIVGINALKINATSYEGLGFAVPSATVIKVINSIIENGIAPKTAKLGINYVQAIYYSQFLSDLIEENNLPGGSIVVASINEDSSLYNSELKVNDIITGVNGQDLTNADILIQLIQNSNVGDTLELSVIRILMNEDGTDYTDIQEFTITATLVEKTNEEDNSATDNSPEDFYEYFGDDSGSYEDFYEYFYDYFYGGSVPDDGNNSSDNSDQFTIPE